MSGREHAPKLLVRVDEGRRAAVERQIWDLLQEIGLTDAQILPPHLAAVVEVWFPGNAKEPLERLVARCEEDPSAFAGTHQWTPVEAWTEASPAGLRDSIARLERTTDLPRPVRVQIHDELSARLFSDVELVEPNPWAGPDAARRAPRAIHVEVVGADAGLSVLGPEDRLDVDAAARRRRPSR